MEPGARLQAADTACSRTSEEKGKSGRRRKGSQAGGPRKVHEGAPARMDGLVGCAFQMGDSTCKDTEV